MDNITHSVIGLVTGAAYARATAGHATALSTVQRRALIVGVAVVANNLPDLDLVYSYGRGGLAYMLEHRGYTHTIVGCLCLALALYAAAAWLTRRRVPLSRADHVTLAGVALAGTALHLLMDSLNSYGVHPFWPFENFWMYGDSVYIVEPWYWVAAAPLLFELQSKTARVLLGVLLTAAVGICLLSGLVVAPVAILFTLSVVLLVVAGRRLPGREASLLSVALFVGITLVFIVAGRFAAASAESAARRDFPQDRLLDHVLAPMPANPLCWDALVLEVRGDRYLARHTALSLAPRLISSANCGRGFLDRPTFTPQTRLPVSNSGLEWREFAMPRDRLAMLAATHCDAAALMRFARAPFALPSSRGWTLGDLRFDRGGKAGFSDLEIDASPDKGPCPWTPPWIAPREDLLKQ